MLPPEFLDDETSNNTVLTCIHLNFFPILTFGLLALLLDKIELVAVTCLVTFSSASTHRALIFSSSPLYQSQLVCNPSGNVQLICLSAILEHLI